MSRRKVYLTFFATIIFLKRKTEKTVMTDVFEYRAPFGFLGNIADSLFLQKYMTNLLLQRNKVIKEVAESDKWKEVLPK
jgi:hypothetical protein